MSMFVLYLYHCMAMFFPQKKKKKRLLTIVWFLFWVMLMSVFGDIVNRVMLTNSFRAMVNNPFLKKFDSTFIENEKSF